MSDEKDLDSWVEKAYDGDALAQFVLGYKLMNQAKSHDDYLLAFDWIQASAKTDKKDSFYGKLFLGQMFLYGTEYEDFGIDGKYMSEAQFARAHDQAITNKNPKQQAQALYFLGRSAEAPSFTLKPRDLRRAKAFYEESLGLFDNIHSKMALDFLKTSPEVIQIVSPKNQISATMHLLHDKTWLWQAQRDQHLSLSPDDKEYNKLAISLGEMSDQLLILSEYVDDILGAEYADNFETKLPPKTEKLLNRFDEQPELATAIDLYAEMLTAYHRVEKQLINGFLQDADTANPDHGGQYLRQHQSTKMHDQTKTDMRNDLFILEALSQSLHEYILDDVYKSNLRLSPHDPQ